MQQGAQVELRFGQPAGPSQGLALETDLAHICIQCDATGRLDCRHGRGADRGEAVEARLLHLPEHGHLDGAGRDQAQGEIGPQQVLAIEVPQPDPGLADREPGELDRPQQGQGGGAVRQDRDGAGHHAGRGIQEAEAEAIPRAEPVEIGLGRQGGPRWAATLGQARGADGSQQGSGAGRRRRDQGQALANHGSRQHQARQPVGARAPRSLLQQAAAFPHQ